MASTPQAPTLAERLGAPGDRLRARLGRLRPWQRHLLLAGILAAVLLLLAATAAGAAYWRIYSSASIPDEDSLQHADPTVILDSDGERAATLEPAELRENVALEDLPDHVPDAVLAAEDRRFHDHGGFSVRDMARAAWTNVTAGETRQGASTIHQQYVAMAIADIGDGYLDKFREAATASRLDAEVDKDRVLEMYLNQVPFGRTARGIEAAAQTYFNVPAHELDVEQAALLAGLIAAPTAFDPEENPRGAAARRDFVLDGMRDMGALDDEEAEALIGSELPDLREEPIVDFGPDAYFLEVVREQVPELLDDPSMSVGEGLVVHTTLDTRAQQLVVDELRTRLADLEYTGAAVTIESETGAVRALTGGLDFTEQQFDVATDGDRQAGSAFKTFGLVELVARGYHPDATQIHAPTEYDVERDGAEDDTVGNFTQRDHGEVSAREATVESINTAYVQLGEELGPDRIAEIADEMGIGRDLPAFPSLVLGSAEVTPVELTAAYATLGNEGVHDPPHLVERIERHDGEVLYEHEPEPDDVLDPEVAHVVTDVLEDVVRRGTGTAADLGRPAAGKTGTTDEYRDAWFAGYTPQHTTSVWVGNLDNTPMGGEVSGGSLPAEIWGAYMRELVEPFDVADFPDADFSDLRPLTGLEAPEPGPEDLADLGEDAREEDDEDDEDEDDGGGDGRGPDGEGPPGRR